MEASDVGTFNVVVKRKHTACHKLNDECTCGGEIVVSFLPFYLEE